MVGLDNKTIVIKTGLNIEKIKDLRIKIVRIGETLSFFIRKYNESLYLK